MERPKPFVQKEQLTEKKEEELNEKTNLRKKGTQLSIEQNDSGIRSFTRV